MSSGYAGTGKATLLRDNKQIFLLQQQTVTAGTASMAVQLERVNRSFYPWGVSVQVYFTDANGHPADPGAYELDVQSSDIDADSQYCLEKSLTGTNANASFVERLEFPPNNFYAKYLRVLVKTLTNAVFVSVLVTR
jgi:hypothetical protein